MPSCSVSHHARFRPLGGRAGLVLAIWLGLLIGAARAQSNGTARCGLADGFDFPVGKPDASGYYKARGYTPNGHLGEDWNGRGGGDSDYGDPIWCIGRGVVVFSDDVRVGWGNVVIIRHAYRDETGKVNMIDSLYGHLLERKVKEGQLMERGQLVGTMGSNRGMYPVHLHFEIRKNLKIGMNRSSFARDYSNYYDPTSFIRANRQLQSNFRKYDIPLGLFAPYGKGLSEASSSSGSGRGIDIPIFSDKSKTGDTSPPKEEAPEISEDDFCSRLKAKLSKGKVTDSKGQDSSGN